MDALLTGVLCGHIHFIKGTCWMNTSVPALQDGTERKLSVDDSPEETLDSALGDNI